MPMTNNNSHQIKRCSGKACLAVAAGLALPKGDHKGRSYNNFHKGNLHKPKVCGLNLGLWSVFLFSVFCSLSFAQEANYPKSYNYVNDYANVIPPSEEEKLNSLCGELEKKTGAQIAVATIETSKPEPIDTYAVNLFTRWGVGEKGKDNGLLIVSAIKDRKVWIEVGYGLEGIIPDAFASQIYRKELVPAFRKGEYGKGLFSACQIFSERIAKEKGVGLSSLEGLPKKSLTRQSPLLSFIKFIFSFLFFIFIFAFLGPFALPFLFLGMGGRGGFWGSGGSGGFGGGVGGFGGGSCGGGGAGGGW